MTALNQPIVDSDDDDDDLDEAPARASQRRDAAAAPKAPGEETRLEHGKVVWSATDRAVYERSVEQPAPSDPRQAIEGLLARKAEIQRANHASTFRLGAERELAAIEILLTTLKADQGSALH